MMINRPMLRPLGLFRLKGRAHPTSVVVFWQEEKSTPEQLDLCSRFAEGLQRKEWQLPQAYST
jgi:hypothetical protein